MATALLTERQRALLSAAAKALEDGRATPDNELLVEHEVSLDEAYVLARHLAVGARMLVHAAEETGDEMSLVRSVGMDRIVRVL